MKMKLGIAVVVLMLSLAFIPTVDADTDDSGWYGSQLDVYGSATYHAMESAFEGHTGDSVDIGVNFEDPSSVILFQDAESARKAVTSSVTDALAAAYYQMPLAIWLWNYPVSPVEITAETTEVVMNQTTYHVASSVSFTLNVSDTYAGKVDATLAKVKDATKDMVYEGNDAEKARSIVDNLRGLKVVDAPEGRECDIYDALVLKESSSAGIAAAYTYVAQCNSLQVATVSGMLYTPDSEEGVTAFWNNVRFEDRWYAIDMVMNIESKENKCLMVGSDAIVGDSVFSTTHKADASIQGSTGLDSPSLSRLSYVYPVPFNFIDQYGIYIIAILMVLVVLVVIFKSVKDGTLK